MAIDLATEARFTPKLGSFLVGVDERPVPRAVGNRPGRRTGRHRPLPTAGRTGGCPPPAGPAFLGRCHGGHQHHSGGRRALLECGLLGGLPAGPGPRSGPARAGEVLPERRGSSRLPTSGCSTLWPSSGPGPATPSPSTSPPSRCARSPSPKRRRSWSCTAGPAASSGTSPYADRRSECETAANLIGKPLGQCELGDLSALPGLGAAPPGPARDHRVRPGARSPSGSWVEATCEPWVRS